jgi:hypothetical protein
VKEGSYPAHMIMQIDGVVNIMDGQHQALDSAEVVLSS